MLQSLPLLPMVRAKSPSSTAPAPMVAATVSMVPPVTGVPTASPVMEAAHWVTVPTISAEPQGLGSSRAGRPVCSAISVSHWPVRISAIRVRLMRGRFMVNSPVSF